MFANWGWASSTARKNSVLFFYITERCRIGIFCYIFRSEAPLQLTLSVVLSVCTPLAAQYMAIVYTIHNDSLLFSVFFFKIFFTIFAPIDDHRYISSQNLMFDQYESNCMLLE